MHVTDGVDMHHQGDKANYTHHQRSQVINQETHFKMNAAGYHPGIDRFINNTQATVHLQRQDVH